MRRGILCILTVFSFILSHSQVIPDEDRIDHFYRTKTLVVRNANQMNFIDGPMKEAMESEWNINEWETLPYNEFAEKRGDTNYSFLYFSNIIFEKDRDNVAYKFLNLLLGGEEENLLSIPVTYDRLEESSYTYKMVALVRLMEGLINAIQNNPDVNIINVYSRVNKNTHLVRDKTLYLRTFELSRNRNTEEKIREIYPYDFKLVSRKEIEEAIAQKNNDVVFMHMVGPADTDPESRCYKVLLSAGDPKIYYFDFFSLSTKYEN